MLHIITRKHSKINRKIYIRTYMLLHNQNYCLLNYFPRKVSRPSSETINIIFSIVKGKHLQKVGVNYIFGKPNLKVSNY